MCCSEKCQTMTIFYLYHSMETPIGYVLGICSHPRRVLLKKLVRFGLKTMTIYMQPALVDCISTTYIFYLWMSKGTRDVFVVGVNFISNDWEAKHVTIELFQVSDMNSVAMVPKLQELLDRFL